MLYTQDIQGSAESGVWGEHPLCCLGSVSHSYCWKRTGRADTGGGSNEESACPWRNLCLHRLSRLHVPAHSSRGGIDPKGGEEPDSMDGKGLVWLRILHFKNVCPPGFKKVQNRLGERVHLSCRVMISSHFLKKQTFTKGMVNKKCISFYLIIWPPTRTLLCRAQLPFRDILEEMNN